MAWRNSLRSKSGLKGVRLRSERMLAGAIGPEGVSGWAPAWARRDRSWAETAAARPGMRWDDAMGGEDDEGAAFGEALDAAFVWGRARFSGATGW